MDKRIRSPNYPALSLPESIEKVGAIYRSLHNHSAPREVVAKAMGYASLNGASATAVSALHKYGLLERNGEDIRVSERALRILHPHSASEKAAAIQEAAVQPPLFAELREKFPGSRVNEDLLRNYLARNGFAPAALPAVISAYRDTSDMVERLAEEHGLSVDQRIEEPGLMSHSHAIAPPATPTSPSIPAAGAVFQPGERPIGRYDFEGGRYVRIAAFGDIDTEEALDMIETLVELKRKELARANKYPNATVVDVIGEPTNTDEIS